MRLATAGRTALALLIALGTVTVMTACSGSGGADASALEGTWTLESYRDDTGELVDADASVSSEITFADGEVSGSGGVNSFSGTYEADDGELSFGPLAATLMAGSETAMSQEAGFMAALGSTTEFGVDGDTLTLRDAGGDTVAVLTSS